jgi:hypothetical protein
MLLGLEVSTTVTITAVNAKTAPINPPKLRLMFFIGTSPMVPVQPTDSTRDTEHTMARSAVVRAGVPSA